MTKLITKLTVPTALIALLLTPVTAMAATTAQSTDPQTRITAIKTKGDSEINRRLTSLSSLQSKINGATKLTANDKAYLSSEVNSEINGLTSLKTKLDGDTTLADARTDAKTIFTGYRVYALVVPKVSLIKTADDQQVVEDKLTALAQKLQTRLDAAKSSGKNTTALQAKLNDMRTQISNAHDISSAIEAKVLVLQPSDYNSDHALLSGDSAQLKAAHSNNVAARNDAKAIIDGLKSL